MRGSIISKRFIGDDGRPFSAPRAPTAGFARLSALSFGPIRV